MISAKLNPAEKMRWNIQKEGVNLNFEAQKNLALKSLQIKLGKTAKEIKSVIEKLWLHE